MPAVTWIDIQPDQSSARTSLKSFTDYLTESQDDAPVFTPSNRLCLSPETLNALDSAEKLVDDVERQLSQIHFDDSFTDDTEEDRLNGIRLDDERLRVQNVVRTVFQKGYYEPAPRPVFKRDNVARKHRRDKSKSTRMPSKRVEPVVDECLLCKSESAKRVTLEQGHVEETKINEDKPEKLQVQRGPAISIKGPLAVQTARIVDIQPSTQRTPERAPNIVSYECRHLDEPSGEVEQDALEIRGEQRVSTNKSALNYSRESESIDNRMWDACEDVSLDLADFSLREPRILVEVDAVLEQQRNVIRRVHEATDKFDRFLADSSLSDKASKLPSENEAMSRESLRSERIVKESDKPSEVSKDSSKRNVDVAGKLSVEESKDTLYSDSFESESTDDEIKSDGSVKLELKNIDGEVPSNHGSLARSSLHTETKSSAGFIENLKSSLNLKENNLAVSRKADTSRNDVENADKDLNSNREKRDDQLDEKKRNQLHVSETDDERELHNYQFDADLLEGTNEQANGTEKKIHERVDDDTECKKDKSTEKLQDQLDENSQKTSHLIDSISDVSFHRSSERAKNSQDSQKISSASNHELSKEKENSTELSTESRIEVKLSEARNNLRSLMKTIDCPVNNRAESERGNIDIVDQERYKIVELDKRQSADNEVSQIMKNITLRANDARRQNCRISNGTNVIDQEHNNLPNDRSFIAILQENSDVVQHSLEHRKLLLLKNLESCAIQSPSHGKRLFTSTLVGDAEPPINFTRSSTIRQDSSSDSNSEGEIRLGSTASHSLGEIRKKISETKSSCSTKGSTTTSSANFNNSSSHSVGEFRGLNQNEN